MSVNCHEKSVAIIGLGLLGASLGMALRGKTWKRLGWTRKKEVRENMLKQDVIDVTSDKIEDILALADLTVLCLPVPQIIEYGQKYAGIFKKGSVVTDIGSTKDGIVGQLESVLGGHGVEFLGSHPMAGTEKTGADNAFAELYNCAKIFITPTQHTSEYALECVESLWRSIETFPVRIDSMKHDVLVAHTSHISHIIALALTQAVLDCDEGEIRDLRFAGCARGFRDTSRITSSSPTMWREIIESNRPAVLQAIKGVEKRWLHITKIIEDSDFDALEEEFGKGKKLRDGWMDARYGKGSK